MLEEEGDLRCCLYVPVPSAVREKARAAVDGFGEYQASARTLPRATLLPKVKPVPAV